MYFTVGETPTNIRNGLNGAKTDTSRPRVSQVVDTRFVTQDVEFQNAVVTLVSRRRFLIREIERTINAAEDLRSELLAR